MKKPTPSEVEAYALTVDYKIDGEAFCDFYESKGWKVGTSQMVSWQAAVRTWKRRNNQNSQNSQKVKKTKLWPINGKNCSFPGCHLPAVYKTSGAYDHWYCPFHMPDEVKAYYE